MRDNSPRPHHLNLAVGGGDAPRTADFYRNLLELTPSSCRATRTPTAPRLRRCRTHGATSTTSSLMTPGFAARHGLPVNPLGSGHLAFRVDDIAGGTGAPRRRGIPYSDMGEWAIKGWHQLFCADPDGRVIEFHQVLDAVGAKDA